MEIFTSARGSAKNVFAVIDRQSEIDPMNTEGKVLNSSEIRGNIEFKNLFFNYPSRPDVKVKTNKFSDVAAIQYIIFFLDFEWIESKNWSWSNGSTGWKFR